MMNGHTVVPITEDSITAYTPDCASVTVHMDNLTFHGLENLADPTSVPEGTNPPAPEPPTATPVPAFTRGDPCKVGIVLSPGDYCTITIPGIITGTDRFQISDDGFGCVGGICSGSGVNLNGFVATRNVSTWTILSLP